MKPICEDIKDLLVAAGYTFGTNLFVSKMPSNNLNVVTLYDTSATTPDTLLVTDIRNNSFEVLICNVGYQAAYTEAEKIKAALDGLYNFTLNGSDYLLVNIANGPNELPTHSLSEDDGKVYLSLNFIAKRKAVVEDESTMKVAEIINSTETFSHELAFKEVYPLADNEYVDTDGIVKSVPYGEQAVCTIPETQGVDIHNTDNTFQYHAADGEDVELENITHIDSTGEPVIWPGMKPFVATIPPDNRNLNVQFLATYDDNITLTATADEATTWTTETLTNVATIAYEKNSVAASLPITLAASDTLKITITRTNAALDSKVKLTNA